MDDDIAALLRSHDELRGALRLAGRLIRRMRRLRNVDPRPTLLTMRRVLDDQRELCHEIRRHQRSSLRSRPASATPRGTPRAE